MYTGQGTTESDSCVAAELLWEGGVWAGNACRNGVSTLAKQAIFPFESLFSHGKNGRFQKHRTLTDWSSPQGPR